ncbi:hypothetical protein WR25_22089 [Diploscapter pachys]|uniref:Uncharacterized protein n=1 Tax=Diploscapter pachys TaxID=2018661 RepID=A0A2A2LVX2_9BILA|nr:hypothetical protein WR25_22089 [Diploscapter pachys]
MKRPVFHFSSISGFNIYFSSANTQFEIIEEIRSGKIKDDLKPFINETAVRILYANRQKWNETEDGQIIRDEDVLAEEEGINEARFDGRKTMIKVTWDAGRQLAEHWLQQGLSSLLSVIATNKMNGMPRIEQKKHFNCSKKAKTVKEHAKCVVGLLKIRDEEQRRKSVMRSTGWPTNFLGIVSRQKYELLDERPRGAMAMVARQLTNTVRLIKKKSGRAKSWRNAIDEIKEEVRRMKKKRRARKALHNRFSTFANLMKQIKNLAFYLGMDDLIEDEEELDEKTAESTMKPEQKAVLNQECVLGVKIGLAMNGVNVSNFDNRNINFISPRIMSLIPEHMKNDTISLFSPSILSLHEDGDELEKKLSLNRAMQLFEETGQEHWLNFVIEASGVSDAVEMIRRAELEQERQEMMEKFKDNEGRPLYMTKENVSEVLGRFEKKKIDTLEELNRRIDHQQMSSLNSSGYAVLTPDQIHLLYGPSSPFNDTRVIQHLLQIDRKKVPRLLEETIHKLASEEIQFKSSIRHDIILQFLAFMPIINAPNVASQPLILSPPEPVRPLPAHLVKPGSVCIHSKSLCIEVCPPSISPNHSFIYYDSVQFWLAREYCSPQSSLPVGEADRQSVSQPSHKQAQTTTTSALLVLFKF